MELSGAQVTGAFVVCSSEMHVALLRHKSGKELILLGSNSLCTLGDCCLINWSPTEEKQLSAKKDGFMAMFIKEIVMVPMKLG